MGTFYAESRILGIIKQSVQVCPQMKLPDTVVLKKKNGCPRFYVLL